MDNAPAPAGWRNPTIIAVIIAAIAQLRWPLLPWFQNHRHRIPNRNHQLLIKRPLAQGVPPWARQAVMSRLQTSSRALRKSSLICLLWIMGVTAVSAQSPAITQSTQGWCRPTVGQAGGNVTIVCQGVSPKALERLNELLDEKDIERQTKIQEAETWAQRYRDLQDRLTQEGQDDSLSQTAKALLEEGKLEEAGAILDRLLASGEKTVEQMVADHVNRAAVYELQFQPYKALLHYEKAYHYRPDNTKYALQYAFTLQKQNHHAKAQTVYQEALGTYRKLAQANPQAYLPYVATVLNNLAVLYSDTQRLNDSEQAYQEALGTYRKLAQANSQAYLPYVAMTLNHLGNLYSDMQRLSDSEQAYREALGTYRKLAQANPQAYLPDIALTLNNLAILELDQNHIKQVQVLVSEALIIRRDLYKKHEMAYGNALAQSLAVEAMMLLHTEQEVSSVCDRLHEMRNVAVSEDLKQWASERVQGLCDKTDDDKPSGKQ